MDNIHSFYSDQPETDLAAGLPAEKRTLLGQVFTPYPIARCMASWVTSAGTPESVLDPALGLGIFLRALLEISPAPPRHMVGFEIDPDMANRTRAMFQNYGYTQVKIETASFLSAGWDTRFDAILCNPPYRNFRGLPGKAELAELVRLNTDLKVSQAANLYVYFLIKAVNQLAERGRASFILPYEFLNADYGRAVKQYLLDREVLRKVLILGIGMHTFERVTTTACILCLEQTPSAASPQITLCSSLDELSRAIQAGPEEVDDRWPEQPPISSRKWVAPQVIFKTERGKRLAPLSKYGRVMRGIATGDNRFFVLTEEMRQVYGLDAQSLLPCLAKTSLAPGHFFLPEDFANLVHHSKPVWLLDAVGNEGLDGVWQYIELGRMRGSHLRHLTRNRSPWYAIEKRPPAPLLATTFSRSGVRWVRNEAETRHLTAFHGFYPHPETDLDLLSAYLLTPTAQQILAQNRREYGNGLHKFEPNDLNQALVVDISEISPDLQSLILRHYRDYRSTCLEKRDGTSARAALGAIFREFLG